MLDYNIIMTCKWNCVKLHDNCCECLSCMHSPCFHFNMPFNYTSGLNNNSRHKQESCWYVIDVTLWQGIQLPPDWCCMLCCKLANRTSISWLGSVSTWTTNHQSESIVPHACRVGRLAHTPAPISTVYAKYVDTYLYTYAWEPISYRNRIYI